MSKTSNILATLADFQIPFREFYFTGDPAPAEKNEFPQRRGERYRKGAKKVNGWTLCHEEFQPRCAYWPSRYVAVYVEAGSLPKVKKFFGTAKEES